MAEEDDYIDDEDVDGHFKGLLNRHFLAKDYSYGRLVRAVADEAKKAPPEDQYHLLNKGLDVVGDVMRAVNDDPWRWSDDEETEKPRKFWHHQGSVRLAGKKRHEPYIPVVGVQDAAAAYLDLPYRVPALDRILVDMLVASEMFAFADEIQPFLKRKLPVLLGWLLSNIIGFIVGCALAGFLLWLGGGNTVMNWIAGIVFALTVLGTAWSLIAFPFAYPKVREHHKKLEGIIGAMLDTYAALGGSPASTKHIDERIAAATDKGVVWPTQLIVLMEDIRSRRRKI